MKKRAFVIHGWNSRPDHGWKPWLKRELEGEGFEVAVLEMPNPKLPRRDAWVGKISRAVGEPDQDCYFVGHSLGCIAILRYVEALPQKTRIGGAVLVAGFSDNLGMFLFDSFFNKPLDWKAIKMHCNKFIAIHSDNDGYVPLKHGDIFKNELGAELIIMKGMGHFSGYEGCMELPDALEAVLKLSE
ncbi:MAG TPA: alpha/beta hydrolase [Candidatus Norongarragalinales archaeon]|nr:alpha/beta hydrolase [Candidatus Norongarragalinales archaeon]